MAKGAPDRYTQKGASDRYTDTYTQVIKKRAGRRPAFKKTRPYHYIYMLQYIHNISTKYRTYNISYMICNTSCIISNTGHIYIYIIYTYI